MVDVAIRINASPAGYSLGLAIGDLCVEIQDGYASPKDALHALVETLTFAPPPPPDLTVYDEALGKVGQLMDGVRDLNEGIELLAKRVEEVEGKVAAGAAGAAVVEDTAIGRSAKPAASMSELPLRPPAGAPAPPSIRRRPAAPHRPAGGVFRMGGDGEE